MVSWQAFPSLLPRAPLAFLSRPKLPFLKLPFPSLSNASHAGYVKRYMTKRWFSRIVGPLGRSYVKVALKLKVKITCWKDRARDQSDCGTKPF